MASGLHAPAARACAQGAGTAGNSGVERTPCTTTPACDQAVDQLALPPSQSAAADRAQLLARRMAAGSAPQAQGAGWSARPHDSRAGTTQSVAACCPGRPPGVPEEVKRYREEHARGLGNFCSASDGHSSRGAKARGGREIAGNRAAAPQRALYPRSLLRGGAVRRAGNLGWQTRNSGSAGDLF